MSDLDLVDPELRGVLDLMPVITLSDELLPTIRAGAAASLIQPPELDGVTVEERYVAGPAGAPDVRVLIYRPSVPGTGRPAMLRIHGGGFVMGSAEMTASEDQKIAKEIGAVVVSVDYRLAPETTYPGPLEDCYAALAWMNGQAGVLGIDPRRIGISGHSAGGGLAAGLALLARDRGEFAIAFQHLIYPMLDDRTCIDAQPHPYAGHHVWTTESNRYGWSALLGKRPGAPDVEPYAAPARAADLQGLPPTFLAVGALDLFLEENLEYVRRLARAGVPAELHVYPGAYHGFQMTPDAAVVQTSQRDSFAALQNFLAR